MSIWQRVRTLLGFEQSSIVEAEGDGAHPGSSPGDVPPVPHMQVNRDSEVEKAARLRIQQVQRALRSAAGEAPSDEAAEGPGSEPPWARGKNRPGRLPSGPGRPQDAAFVLTVVFQSDLPDTGEALAKLLAGPIGGPVGPEPRVRLIPLVRNGVSEPGYAAEIMAGERRAFLVYRKQPYGEAGGAGHMGLFIGGPAIPDNTTDPALIRRRTEEGRLLGALARALLTAYPDALGLYENRANKAWKPREQALTELTAADPPAAEPPADPPEP